MRFGAAWGLFGGARLAAWPVLMSIVAGCAASPPRSAPASAPATSSAPASATPVPAVRYGGPWEAKLGVDHALTGGIWDSARGAFVTEDALVERLVQARFVFLGERHDQPDHHRLQAAMLEALIGHRRRPAVAFEMIDLDRQPEVDEARKAAPADPDAIARAVDWDKSGWPAWSMYRPIFAAAVAAGLPIVAADYPSHAIRALFRPGAPDAPPVDPATQTRYGLDKRLPPEAEASLEDELRASHCGQLPEEMIPMMVVAQRLRDGAMADRLEDAVKTADGAVLVSGAGHARTDRGAPFVLRGRDPGAALVSLAFFEVEDGAVDPAGYAGALGVPGAKALPFDYVWFTPRLDDADHCAALKAHMKAAP